MCQKQLWESDISRKDVSHWYHSSKNGFFTQFADPNPYVEHLALMSYIRMLVTLPCVTLNS